MPSPGSPSELSPRWYSRPEARAWICGSPPPREALAFHAGLPGYEPTPLVELPALADELAVRRVLVKDESVRLGLSSFKVLGASWAIAGVVAARAGLPGPWTVDALRSVATRHPLTLVTATDGNHGLAVAHVAALLGPRAHVFLPRLAGPEVVAAIQAKGADVTIVAGDHSAAVRQAAGYSAGRASAELVQDTGWPGYEQVPSRIVDGYATLLWELDSQLLEAGVEAPHLIAVPVGVGSLAQAVLRHVRSRSAGRLTSVLGVEPDVAACVLASLAAGSSLSVHTGDTTMAGLNCGTPSSLAWPYLRDGLDAAATVGDDETARAVDDLRGLGVPTGPSGAAALAGVRAAVTGSDSRTRRAQLGIDADAVIVLLNTEGPNPSSERSDHA